MERFSDLFRRIDKTTSTLAKVHALKQYFLEEKPDNAVWAMYLLLGKRRKRTVTSRTLREIFTSFSDLPEWLLKECYSHVGDTAETIALLLKNPKAAPESPPVELHEWLEERIPKLSEINDQTRSERIVQWWTRLHSSQVFVLNKIMTGRFRVGVSQKLIVRALSQAFDVPEPVLTHRLMGTWKPEGEFFKTLITKDIGEMPPSTPYPFFLASPLEDEQKILSDLDRWQVEWKWDGIRAQVIKREGNLYI
jgi:DNA ligase-1